MAALEIPSDERGILEGFLGWDRAVVGQKALGLDRDGATRVATPSGLTGLGLVTHLTYVEGRWFRHHLAGVSERSDIEGSFVPDPDLSVETAVAADHAACAASRAIAADLSLDSVGAIPNELLGPVTLRHTMVHMIDETARHLGHLDVLREMTDGQVGDG
ncbi:MAG TPA: DUF664 domain-containing protein [Iamia sp.]|nr:DUF664 domain-containing protein [Iamia sp.]